MSISMHDSAGAQQGMEGIDDMPLKEKRLIVDHEDPFFCHRYFIHPKDLPDPRVKRPDHEGRGDLSLRGDQSFVTVSVGSGTALEHFKVQKSVICHYSPYFNALFNSMMVEGRTQTVLLDDVTPDIFALVLDWLFTQKLKDTSSIPEYPGILSPSHCAELWVLADRFLMPRLQNEVMSTILKPYNRILYYRQEPTLKLYLANFFNFVYTSTGPGSRLRAAAVEILMDGCDHAARRGFDDEDKADEEEDNREPSDPNPPWNWKSEVCVMLEEALESDSALDLLKLLLWNTEDFELYRLTVEELEEKVYMPVDDGAP